MEAGAKFYLGEPIFSKIGSVLLCYLRGNCLWPGDPEILVDLVQFLTIQNGNQRRARVWKWELLRWELLRGVDR